MKVKDYREQETAKWQIKVKAINAEYDPLIAEAQKRVIELLDQITLESKLVRIQYQQRLDKIPHDPNYPFIEYEDMDDPDEEVAQ
jgi:hypothetical protein